MDEMVINMPVAMHPGVWFVDFEHIVETSSSHRRDIILVHTPLLDKLWKLPNLGTHG